MLTHHVDQENQVIELTIAGHVTREELTEALKAVEGPLNDWDTVRVLKRVDSFEGMDWMALVDDLKFAYNNLGNIKKIKKAALVTDKQWVANLTKLAEGLFPGEIKVFEAEDIEQARAWLR